LRPCGTEDSASRMRHHWSNVIKAASYLRRQLLRDTFIRKERGDKSMMSGRLITLEYRKPDVSQLGRVW
jgi:hypothetical protein